MGGGGSSCRILKLYRGNTVLLGGMLLCISFQAEVGTRKYHMQNAIGAFGFEDSSIAWCYSSYLVSRVIVRVVLYSSFRRFLVFSVEWSSPGIKRVLPTRSIWGSWTKHPSIIRAVVR